MTIPEIAETHSLKQVTLRKWAHRLYPDAKVGPIYSLAPAQVRRLLAAMAAAKWGWRKGRKRAGQRGPALDTL